MALGTAGEALVAKSPGPREVPQAEQTNPNLNPHQLSFDRLNSRATLIYCPRTRRLRKRRPYELRCHCPKITRSSRSTSGRQRAANNRKPPSDVSPYPFRTPRRTHSSSLDHQESLRLYSALHRDSQTHTPLLFPFSVRSFLDPSFRS
jgi:hypothetical protein